MDDQQHWLNEYLAEQQADDNALLALMERHDEAAEEGYRSDPELTEEDAERLLRERASFKQHLHDSKLFGYLSAVESPRLPEDIAFMLEDGIPPVEMLLDDWLVAHELHWIYAEAEAWKTWVALVLALDLMREGKTVVWFDEELGAADHTRRLKALGAEPEVIHRHFRYFAFPDWKMTEEQVIEHATLLQVINPALVVYDTATDMLTAADKDENLGKDTTEWVKAYPEQARRLGITQLVLDHTPKGGDTAVGSRAKRAKAKVMFKFETTEGGDQNNTAELTVTRRKNTPGAIIPQKRTYRIGGDGSGRFVFTEIDPKEIRKEKRQASILEEIKRQLREKGPLNTSQLVKVVHGAGNTAILNAAKEAATRPATYGIRSKLVGSSVVYELCETDGVPDLGQLAEESTR
jgi:hypothetical protein